MTGTKKICNFREKWYSPPNKGVSRVLLGTDHPFVKS